jgi:hypothetical protein
MRIDCKHTAGEVQIAGSVDPALVEFTTGIRAIDKPLAVGRTLNLLTREGRKKRNPFSGFGVVA